MGVSIHGDAVKVDDAVRQIDKFVFDNGGYRDGALRPREWFNKVAGSFGAVLDNYFVTVYNEYYEDYNPESNFNKAVTEYYFPDWDFEDWEKDHFYLDTTVYFGGGANAEEVLSSEFEDEFGYEGKFRSYDY